MGNGDIADMFGSLTGVLEPKLLIRLRHKLEKAKIKKVKHRNRFDLDIDCYENLTLLIYPTYYNTTTPPPYRVLGHDVFEELKKMRGYNTSSIREYYRCSEERTKIKVKIPNIDREIEIGCLLKERNVIILYFDIITYTRISDLFNNKLLFFFIDGLIDWCVKNKIKKVPVKDYMRKRLIKRYGEEIRKEIRNKEQQIEQRRSRLKDYQTTIIKDIQQNSKDTILLRELIKMEKRVGDTINKQMKEIKELPFVKSVKLLTKGIRINVGKIYINWERKKVFIGEFYVYICPSEIKIENKKQLSHESKKGLIHPHINRTNICFGGERANKIYELLAKYEYKKVIYMVYLFLKTYTKNDKFNSINYWIEAKDGISYYKTSDNDENNGG